MAAKFKLFLAVLLLTGSYAQGAVSLVPGVQLSQLAFIDLADLSHSFFRSRLKVSVTEKLIAPNSIRTSTDQATDDLGNARDTTYVILDGENLFEQTIAIDEVDSLGNVLRPINSQNYSTTELVSLAANRYDFFPTPLVHVRPELKLKAFSFVDSTGKRLLVTLDLNLQPILFMEPESKQYVVATEPAVEINASFAFLPQGQDYSPGPVFSLQDQAVPTRMAKAEQCHRRGEVLETSPILFGSNLQATRVEQCYPTNDNQFERVVFIRSNPSHEPANIIQRVDFTALGRGGSITTSPIYKIPPNETSFTNCHGYAVLAILGAQSLPEHASWLQATTTNQYTLGTQPFETILRTHFRQLFSVPASYNTNNAESQLALDPRLHEGDLITFVGSGGFAHSGVIRLAPNRKSWWIESKYEEGPVLDTPITSVHDVIPNLYTEIRVFRKIDNL